uniref:Uncharacterized protein n=1 Tax=Nelumbo nucifera TaxID=4432 RepID=A0A822XZD2_NELNU|nr:TPA_asm: hypothetical protein HUJ06_024201 [Nelumbo nucifera]
MKSVGRNVAIRRGEMMMVTMLRSAGVSTLEASPYSGVMVHRIMMLALLCVVVALPCVLIYNAAFTF